MESRAPAAFFGVMPDLGFCVGGFLTSVYVFVPT